ncbi:MAG: UbiD family decarboxylase [Opitutaceae bacterium]|nr:UbiD family decarboxylase [Opitutaceae bacterium]
MLSLADFLAEHRAAHVVVTKPVELRHVGALTAQARETIVFDRINQYPGFRLVDQLFVNRAAQARVLGCAAGAVVPALQEVLRRGPRPLVTLPEAPCQEVVWKDEEADLRRLPIVTHTDIDPYPYTTSFAVHRDPETKQFNQMYPRCGVLSANEMVCSFVTSTANRILGKYRQRQERMPQAIVIGCHPAWELAGCYSHPHKNWWEMELFEAITGHRGEVVKCLSHDLVVPADASIVIEGFVHPSRMAQDGPSPGPTCLFTPYAEQQPVFEVTAITLRREPIYRNHMMTPFTDHQEMPRLFHEAIIYEKLQAMGVPVRDVHFPQGGAALMVLLQIEPVWEGQATDALLCALGSSWLNMKMAVAVDPDIDIYDPREVEYALATRVDPTRDLIIVNNGRGFPFDPSARTIPEFSPNAAASRFPCIVGKWGINATKPPAYRAAERRNYERAWPQEWGKVSLQDYVSEPAKPVTKETM